MGPFLCCDSGDAGVVGQPIAGSGVIESISFFS